METISTGLFCSIFLGGYAVYFFPSFAGSSLFCVLSGQQTGADFLNMSYCPVGDLKRPSLACASAIRNLTQRDDNWATSPLVWSTQTLPVSSCCFRWVCLCLPRARNLLAVIQTVLVFLSREDVFPLCWVLAKTSVRPSCKLKFYFWRGFSDPDPWLWKGCRDHCNLLWSERVSSQYCSTVLFSHPEVEGDEIQLQQNGSSAARAGSWVFISSFCFGPHRLSIRDWFQFPVLWVPGISRRSRVTKTMWSPINRTDSCTVTHWWMGFGLQQL